MVAADLVRTFGLKPNDLVVFAGPGGVLLLNELRICGCRVLRLDPNAVGWDDNIDTIRSTLTPTVERLVRDRYGPVALLLQDGAVVEVNGRTTAVSSRAA